MNTITSWNQLEEMTRHLSDNDTFVAVGRHQTVSLTRRQIRMTARQQASATFDAFTVEEINGLIQTTSPTAPVVQKLTQWYNQKLNQQHKPPVL